MQKLANRIALDDQTLQEIKAHMQDVMNISGVYFVMLCSTDGFELISLQKRKSFNTSKLAAVSSSILAMISAFLKEIQLIGCQSITLDAENAKAVLTSIQSRSQPLILVTLAEQEVLLGQLLHALKKVK